MKTWIWTRNLTALVAWLVLGSACASPTQQLIDEALITGDWTEVENREAAMSRRQTRGQPTNCAPEHVGVCTAKGRLKKRACTCESFSDVSHALDQDREPDFQ